MSIKIIAGKYRGLTIKTLPNDKTRPLLSRAKKSLFDILTPRITNATFLDLFAGFGTVGIEALSRGAKKVIFVENDSNCVKVIEENLKKLGELKNADIIRTDASHLDNCEYMFDIIFIGPPYSAKILTDTIVRCEKLLLQNGLIIGQHHKKEVLTEQIGELSLYRQEKYGDMRLSFYKRHRLHG